MRQAGVIALTACVLAAACSSGRTSTNAPVPVPATTPRSGFDLRRIATATPAAALDGPPQAAALARESLAALPPGGASPLQLLVPQLFNNASALDLLRLSTDVGAPPAGVPALLHGLGWIWLVVEDGVAGGGAGYRQLRVVVAGFTDAGGAARYVASPFLLPPALATGGAAELPSGLPPGARMLRAADAVVPLTDPGTAREGERAVVLWQRGRIVFQVIESVTPAPVDLTVLAQLAATIDNGRDRVPGVTP